VRILKCLHYDEMVGSKIYMFKDVNLSNMLFLAVYFVILYRWTKNIQNA